MVGKALQVLSVLGEHPEGIGLSELARRVGYPVSTTHRLLGSLQEHGFARSDPASKRYALGLRLFELGQQVSHARGFAGAALPVLRALTEQTGEPTLMAVLDGHDQVYVHSVQGPQQIQIRGEPGKRGPLHCTSMGKCLVAFSAARDQLLASLELVAHAPRTITSREEFAREIESVRARGYAVADEEHEPGIRAVGVPVLGVDDIAVAAVSTAAPAYRMPLAQLESFVPALQAAARELGAVLPRVA